MLDNLYLGLEQQYVTNI